MGRRDILQERASLRDDTVSEVRKVFQGHSVLHGAMCVLPFVRGGRRKRRSNDANIRFRKGEVSILDFQPWDSVDEGDE